MDDRAVGHLFVVEGADTLLAAGFHDIVHKGGVVFGKARPQLRNLKPKEAPDKIAIGLVAPQEAGTVPVDLDDAHGQRVEGMQEGVFILVGDYCQVIEVDAPDGLVIGGLLRVLVTDLDSLLVPLNDLFHGDRLAVIEALQLRAADLLEEMRLLLRLHAFAHRIHAERGRHNHELRQDDFPAFVFIQLPQKAHVELQQIELDALKHIQ